MHHDSINDDESPSQDFGKAVFDALAAELACGLLNEWGRT